MKSSVARFPQAPEHFLLLPATDQLLADTNSENALTEDGTELLVAGVVAPAHHSENDLPTHL
jgi:hypothetical protein